MTPTLFLENFELLAATPNAVAKLRELILEFAASGRLTSQSDEGDSGAALAARISLRFESMRRNGEMRGEAVEALDNRDLPPLPTSWEWVRLGNVVDYGSSDKVDSGEIPSSAWLLDLEDIEKDTSRLVRRKTFAESPSKSTKAAFQRGDVLYGKLRPYLNKVMVATEPGFCTTEIIPIRTHGFIVPEYLCYALKRPTYVAYAVSKCYGMNLPRLSTEDARLAPFPLPPLAEQKRIVAKVDELMALCDRLEAQQQQREQAHAALTQAALARFANAPTSDTLEYLFHTSYNTSPEEMRKAILTLAVRGKLCEQSPIDAPVDELLAANDDRRKRVAAKDARADVDRQELLSADDRWDIPDTWQWRGLADLVLFIDYRGRTPNKVDNGIRLLTAKNVRRGVITLQPEEFISETEFDEWMTRGLPSSGDVLFTTEAPMGFAAVVRLTERFALAQRVICFQSYGAIDEDFLVLQILADQFQRILDKNGTGVTAKGIKASKLKQLPIAVPPLAEQRRIVAKVGDLMALVDRLEADLAAARSTGEALMDAVVHELIA